MIVLGVHNMIAGWSALRHSWKASSRDKITMSLDLLKKLCDDDKQILFPAMSAYLGTSLITEGKDLRWNNSQGYRLFLLSSKANLSMITSAASVSHW